MKRTSLSLFALGLLLVPVGASAARIVLDPDHGVYGRGDTFIVSIRVNTDNECINAAHVALQYSTDELRAVDFSRGGSVMSLWVEEPVLDTEQGVVTFSGGIPGGYCGRIPGDPSESNVLGKVVFTVVGAGSAPGTIKIASSTVVYLNDGRATPAELQTHNAQFSLSSTQTQTNNPWLAEVAKDTTPPDPFDVQVQSTRGVFGGKYYLVFGTLDKQSGLDHYELFENGAWKQISSPHTLADQFLQGDIQVKAIDKAGNIRIGEYTPGSAPAREVPFTDLFVILGVLVVVVGIGFAKMFWKKDTPPTTDVSV